MRSKRVATCTFRRPVLEVSGLSVEYVLDRGNVRARGRRVVRRRPGEFVGIVGESGCGKSTLLFAVAQLLSPPAAVTAGSVRSAARTWSR